MKRSYEMEKSKKSIKRGLAVALGSVGLLAGVASATPSTTYWTPASSDIQPYGVWHLGTDNYFTLQMSSDDTVPDLPVDQGVTVGILPFEKIQMEIGVDFFSPAVDPWYFNAKLGTPENSIFGGSPALNVGIFNVGTRSSGSGRTDQNIMHAMAGKTLPFGLGRLHGGYYNGNDKVLLDKNGEPENEGYMVGYDKGFLPSKDGYNRIIFAADYASGKNAIGGGGFGLYYFFTKDISLLTGPVWFNEEAINGEWKWTTQLDINL